MIRWLLHWSGLDDPSGAPYLFWSGIVGDVFLVGAGWAIVRRLNCHVRGCLRVGIHDVVGTPYRTCRKHHPAVRTGAVTEAHIVAAHKDVP